MLYSYTYITTDEFRSDPPVYPKGFADPSGKSYVLNTQVLCGTDSRSYRS